MLIQDLRKLCDVGDVLFKVGKNDIKEIVITEVRRYPHYVYIDNQGHHYFNRNIEKSCFKTREEAEKEIQKRINIIEKRKLLKEYEKELNEKFGIGDHYIIK